MTIRLLAVGDMHLGRVPARLPGALAAEILRYGPAEAWKRTVDQAIEDRVDLVALAGDLVEKDDDYFEAYRDLRAGVERLTEAGIRVVGVSGNHDVLVLPRLAAEIEGFHLLGADGRWEALTHEKGNERLTLHGWSFPRKQVTTSPLTGHTFERNGGVHLGLLHCDRDQRESRYAPVRSDELRASGLDGWLLGHIHRPDALAAPEPCGYLGSLTGLHPGEHGTRGPWRIEIAHGRIGSVEQWPLAPLEWQRIELDLTGTDSVDDAIDRLAAAVREAETALLARRRAPVALGLRIRLTGRTRHAGAVAQRLAAETNIAASQGLHAFVEKVEVATRPEIDLDALSGGRRGRYPALLAQRLLLLDRPADDENRSRLLDAARRRLEPTLDQGRWNGLEPLTLSDEQLARRLADTGARLLEELLDQKRGEAA